MHNIKSAFNDTIKNISKRESEDTTKKSNLLLLLKNRNSNADTHPESDSKKISKKKIFTESRINIPKKKEYVLNLKI